MVTGKQLLERLVAIENEIGTAALRQMQIVVRFDTEDDDRHVGRLHHVSVDAGCTDTPALVLACDQDSASCHAGDG